ncbi:hypothetical protein ACHAWO_003127 [Cyclotella atomus]|jgi:hypothetical protein|uniref:Uncharacterized protein n=1 Tax=Cyclotella atomus TaxID=382360 RepID=A0ABD3NIU5_9STRA
MPSKKKRNAMKKAAKAAEAAKSKLTCKHFGKPPDISPSEFEMIHDLTNEIGFFNLTPVPIPTFYRMVFEGYN